MHFPKRFTVLILSVLLTCQGVEAAIRFQTVIGYLGNTTPGDLVEDAAGNFFIVGGTEFNENRDPLIMKLDSRGNLLWAKTTGSTMWESLENAVLAHDGGYIVTGDLQHTFSKLSAVIMKFDNDGNLVWGREIGGTVNNEARSLTRTQDGGYLISGLVRTEGAGGEDIFLLKVDSNGTQLWTKILGRSHNQKPFKISETSSGQFLLCGYTHPITGISRDLLVMRVQANGSVIWQIKIGSDTNTDNCKSIIETSQGIYFIADSNSFSTNYGIILGKLSSGGSLEWIKLFNGVGNARAHTIFEREGGLMIGGHTQNLGPGMLDQMAMKVDYSGNIQKVVLLGNSLDQSMRTLKPTNDGGYITYGVSTNTGGFNDNIFLKLGQDFAFCGSVYERTVALIEQDIIAHVDLSTQSISLTQTLASAGFVNNFSAVFSDATHLLTFQTDSVCELQSQISQFTHNAPEVMSLTNQIAAKINRLKLDPGALTSENILFYLKELTASSNFVTLTAALEAIEIITNLVGEAVLYSRLIQLAFLSLSNLSGLALQHVQLALSIKQCVDLFLHESALLASVQAVSSPNIQLDIFPLSPSLNHFQFLHSTQNVKVELPPTLLANLQPNLASAAAYHIDILNHFSPQDYTSASALLTIDLYRGKEKAKVTQSTQPIIFKFSVDSSNSAMSSIIDDIFVRRAQSFSDIKQNRDILCLYFNPEELLFSEEGCELHSLSEEWVECRCYHLSDFMLFVRSSYSSLLQANFQAITNLKSLTLEKLVNNLGFFVSCLYFTSFIIFGVIFAILNHRFMALHYVALIQSELQLQQPIKIDQTQQTKEEKKQPQFFIVRPSLF